MTKATLRGIAMTELTREQIEAVRDYFAEPSWYALNSVMIENHRALCDLALIGLDAEAMAQAAEAKGLELAADRVMLYAEHGSARDAQLCYHFAEAIRALTPSSGPWKRVPEGSVVARKEEVMGLERGQKIASDLVGDRVRAMLAEVKK
jgi:hypothetical protein